MQARALVPTFFAYSGVPSAIPGDQDAYAGGSRDQACTSGAAAICQIQTLVDVPTEPWLLDAGYRPGSGGESDPDMDRVARIGLRLRPGTPRRLGTVRDGGRARP